MNISEQLILSRYKNEFKIFATAGKILNSYTKVKITLDQKDYILGRFTPNIQTYTITQQDEEMYDRCVEVLKSINKDNLEERLPNKTVITDRLGTSKLILSSDKTEIQIAKRKTRKDGTVENSSRSPGTCYIDDIAREKFFAVVKQTVGPQYTKFGTKYALYSYQGHIFDVWREAMEREYLRLCNKNK